MTYHTKISLAKSIIRITGFFVIAEMIMHTGFSYLATGVYILIFAEVLGILEELR